MLNLNVDIIAASVVVVVAAAAAAAAAVAVVVVTFLQSLELASVNFLKMSTF